jgi:hypothetical protein
MLSGTGDPVAGMAAMSGAWLRKKVCHPWLVAPAV